MSVKNLQDFKNLCENFINSNDYKEPIAFGIAKVIKGKIDPLATLVANYATTNYKQNPLFATMMCHVLKECGVNIDFNKSEFVADLTLDVAKKAWEILQIFKDELDKHKNAQAIKFILDTLKNENAKFKITFLFEDLQPESVESVYLKLYLLSSSKVSLRSINLNGAFGILKNVAWDINNNPIELEWLRKNEIELKISGKYPSILSVDKFPRYLSHIIPDDNTRILETSKVRMGAQLHAGTTIMPGAAYVNFNAGTTGAVMVEGRVSSSVIVGDGSDVGGGASILGVLSGTNGNPVSIGKNCLLGANSVTGIPFGDQCIIDGGIAILEGTKVLMSQKDKDELSKINPNFNFDKEIYKAKELAGLNGLHFRQNSQTGQICVAVSKRAIKLNKDLH